MSNTWEKLIQSIESKLNDKIVRPGPLDVHYTIRYTPQTIFDLNPNLHHFYLSCASTLYWIGFRDKTFNYERTIMDASWWDLSIDEQADRLASRFVEVTRTGSSTVLQPIWQDRDREYIIKRMSITDSKEQFLILLKFVIKQLWIDDRFSSKHNILFKRQIAAVGQRFNISVEDINIGIRAYESAYLLAE